MNKLTGPAEPFEPISGPCAWAGPEMAKRTDWIYDFAPAEIAEIEAAVASVKQRGLSILDVRQADFALPTLAPVLARIRDDLVDGCGISLMRGLPVGRWSREESAIAYWGLGVNRVDHFDMGLGLETFLADEKVRPFAEYTILVPVNRQGYACRLNNPSADLCMAREPLAPQRLTIGSRFLPWKRGFNLLAGLRLWF